VRDKRRTIVDVSDDEDVFAFTTHEDAAGDLIFTPGLSLTESRRRSVEERQQIEARFRSAPFPLFGLPPSWNGARFLGGGWWAGMQGHERTKALSLVHGSVVRGGGPILGVETASEFSIGGGALLNGAGMVWEGVSSSIEEAIQDLARDDPPWDLPDSFPVRTGLVLPVDAVPTSFDAFVDSDGWVARAEVGPHFVTVTGTSFDTAEVELERIIDIEPHIVGTRHLYERD
jgi:hypothetical protein